MWLASLSLCFQTDPDKPFFYLKYPLPSVSIEQPPHMFKDLAEVPDSTALSSSQPSLYPFLLLCLLNYEISKRSTIFSSLDWIQGYNEQINHLLSLSGREMTQKKPAIPHKSRDSSDWWNA